MTPMPLLATPPFQVYKESFALIELLVLVAVAVASSNHFMQNSIENAK